MATNKEPTEEDQIMYLRWRMRKRHSLADVIDKLDQEIDWLSDIARRTGYDNKQIRTNLNLLIENGAVYAMPYAILQKHIRENDKDMYERNSLTKYIPSFIRKIEDLKSKDLAFNKNIRRMDIFYLTPEAHKPSRDGKSLTQAAKDSMKMCMI